MPYINSTSCINCSKNNINDNIHIKYSVDILLLFIPIILLVIIAIVLKIKIFLWQRSLPRINNSDEMDSISLHSTFSTPSINNNETNSTSETSINSETNASSEVNNKKIFIEGVKQYILRSENINKETCSICIEAYKENEITVTLPCGHLFHKECVGEWVINKIQSSETPDCPLCRKELLVK